MVSAATILIDDFDHPDGVIDETSTNNLGTNYYTTIGSLYGCSYLNNEAYCSESSTYYNTMSFTTGQTISFDMKCDSGQCIITFLNSANNPLITISGYAGSGIYIGSLYHPGMLTDHYYNIELNGSIYGSYFLDAYIDGVYLGYVMTNGKIPATDITRYSFQHNAGASLYLDDLGLRVCEPNWTCSGYSCTYIGYEVCNAVTDQNNCGISYDGNYSEFPIGGACGTNISECSTLNSGGVYLLTNNIGSGDTCINVAANNVIINGQGHTINGSISALTWMDAYTGLSIYNTSITKDILSHGSDPGMPANGGSGGSVSIYDTRVRYIYTYGINYPNGGDGGNVIATNSRVDRIYTYGGNSGEYMAMCFDGGNGGSITLTNTYYALLVSTGGTSFCATPGIDGVQTIIGGCQYDWIAYYDPTTCPSSGQWTRYYTDLGACGLIPPIGNGELLSCSYTPPVYANQTFNNVTTTDLNTVEDISAVEEFTVATTSSAVQFVNPVDLSTTNITNIAEVVLMSSTAISIDTTTVPQLSAPAEVALSIPETTSNQCQDFLLYYTPGFYTTESEIISNGYIIATGANVGGDCNDPTICTNVNCTDGVLTFTAQHFSGFGLVGLVVDTPTNDGLNNTKNLVYAGLILLGVLLFATIAFGMIQLLKGGSVDLTTLTIVTIGGAIILMLAFVIIWYVFKALGGS